MLKAAGVDSSTALAFAAADLTSDAGWPEAAAGCRFVLHVASPFPPAAPKHEDELIIPAREGALRVLKAARDGGAQRVVITAGKEPTLAFDGQNWWRVRSPRVSAVNPNCWVRRFFVAGGGIVLLKFWA